MSAGTCQQAIFHLFDSPLSEGAGAYAGIGSRKTPLTILALMVRAAGQFARVGWTLRTGLAGGADQAFYRGAASAGPVELYLPWPGFESSARRTAADQLISPCPSRGAYEIAAQFHPGWERLSSGARHLHARNTHQILGRDLKTPAAFVLCWTPDGSLNGRGRQGGGTGQALRLASHHGIPVVNLARPDHAERLRTALASCAVERDGRL